MTGALHYLLWTGKGCADIARALGFVSEHRKRTNYSETADAGYSIGSGAVESGNRVLVTLASGDFGRDTSRDSLGFRGCGSVMSWLSVPPDHL